MIPMLDHRTILKWPQIYNMVAFRNVVADAAITNWWTNDDDQVAFSRGNKGFVAFNNGNTALRRWLTTGLSAGRYCDVISGMLSGGRCTGKTIDVNENSLALIEILPNDLDGVVAIYGKKTIIQSPITIKRKQVFSRAQNKRKRRF
ncbi:alpha-amylase 4N [Cephus cinctus]|uniref:Alpha-amylase 4N n=1 Tax=Cephus cinctus TaxID=211228 RepID=A0AAJ7RRV2_CEPCN|nr:alpha-amylase 4N [Cephus cinctus]